MAPIKNRRLGNARAASLTKGYNGQLGLNAQKTTMIQNTADDAIEIRASLDGMELRFSSNLMCFLANRKAGGRFRLGDWLQALDGDMLGHLQQLAEMALHGSPAIGTALEDLVLVVMHALAAERQAGEVVFDKDELGRHVELLCMLANLERLRRRGLLSYASAISIELDADNSFVLSPDAFAQGDDIRRQMARGLH